MKRQGKSRELCSLSAKMTTSFLSRYERFAFIGWQESMLDSRDGVKHAVLQGVKRNILLYKGKNAKALQMESMQHVSLSGERGGPSKMGESRMLYVRK